MPATTSLRLLPFVAFAAFLGASLGASAPALADCQEDMGKIMSERLSLIGQLNKLTGGQKKQLDPTLACPKLRTLAGVESKLVGFLEKNKDWCNIPDQYVEQAKAGFTKTSAIAGQACKVAAQVAKMKQQQAEGGPGAQQVQRLPTGPL